MKKKDLSGSFGAGKILVFIEPMMWLLAIVIYVYVAYTSFGYDDEYFNIRVVTEHHFRGMIHEIQTSDLHPPLSYILNYFLYQITGNWSVVRSLSAIFFLSTLFYTTRSIEDRFQRILMILLLGLNATILLWVTGLRWYAYLLPLLLIWAKLPDNHKWYYWPKFFLLLLLICFTGYVGFFLAVPYFIYYWLSDKRSIKNKIFSASKSCFLFLLGYGYQFYIFITVHSKMNFADESNKQVFDLKASISAMLSSMVSNQGVFPLSWPGLCSIAGAGIIYLVMVISVKKTLQQNQLILFLGTSILFLLTGIAGKVRNLVLLEPSRANLFSKAVTYGKTWGKLGFVFIMIGNVAGIYHVISHQQTTKNGWNIPLTNALTTLDVKEMKDRQEVYFTHHPTFTFYLLQNKKRLISFYNTLYFDSSRIPFSYIQVISDTSKRSNYTFILTYPGQSISEAVHQKMQAAMRTVVADSVRHFYLGRDKDFILKQHFFPGYPEYSVEIVKYYGVRSSDKSRLTVWNTGR